MGKYVINLEFMHRKSKAKNNFQETNGCKGLIYCNVNDSRLFVPKRNGLGITINFGNFHS